MASPAANSPSDRFATSTPTSAYSNAPASPQSLSPLFRLPRELRDRIYAYALTTGASVQYPPPLSPHGIKGFPLILTSRTIYHEATPLLYAQNRFSFTHPSDINMFVHISDARYARKISYVSLRIRDRDLGSLWTGYLSSSSLHRSLTHDLPCLRMLQISFKTSHWGPDPAESFSRWLADPSLEQLCLSLKNNTPEGSDVRILCAHRIARRDVDDLMNSYYEQLSQKSSDDVATSWKRVHGLHVCLQLTPVDAGGSAAALSLVEG